MNKRLLTAAVAAALTISASTASAQLVINFQYLSAGSGNGTGKNVIASNVGTNIHLDGINDAGHDLGNPNESGGGGFNFKATSVKSGSTTMPLTFYTAYCFGMDQSLNSSVTKDNVAGIDYRVMTFAEFTSWSRPSTYDRIDYTNLNQMASLASHYTTGQTASDLNKNGLIQDSIWRIAKADDAGFSQAGYASGGINDIYSSTWRVLIDKRFWDSTPVTFANAYQPMLIKIPSTVPEPTTYALMAAGLAGLGVLSRRRRNATAAVAAPQLA